MRANPIRTAQEEFNRAYWAILRQLDPAFNGRPGVLASGVGAMYRLGDQGRALMQVSTEDGLESTGPTLEYVVRA